MAGAIRNEGWRSGGSHEVSMGRWSRTLARHFVDGLHEPSEFDRMDGYCGTGAFTATILERCSSLDEEGRRSIRRSLMEGSGEGAGAAGLPARARTHAATAG